MITSINQQRVLQPFQGMKDSYNKAMYKYWTVQRSTEVYAAAYINEAKEEAKQAFMQDKRERADQAKKELNAIYHELKDWSFKDPYLSRIDKQVITTEDKVLAEMQRDKEMKLLEAEMLATDETEDFRRLLVRYGSDKLFHDLITAEMRSRAQRDGDKGGKFHFLLTELDREPDENADIRKIEVMLTNIANMEAYPKGLEEEGNVESIQRVPLFEKID